MRKLNIAQSKNRFDYVAYDNLSKEIQGDFKQDFMGLERRIENLIDGRSRELAVTALEEAYMWVGKAIRDDQIIRNGAVKLQEERSDS
jgi:hypothetical protein